MPASNITSEFRNGDLVFLDQTNGAFPLPLPTSANMATQTKSANYTLTAADSGKITYVDTDAFDLTLPATVVGYTYTIINAGLDGAVLVTISPNVNDKIVGGGLTGSNDGDLTNTKSSAKRGDYVRLVADGVNGWFVQELRGTWAVA